ncbi:glycosyltransferase family 2 protein [Clostridium gasigenes]|uniref:Glycosyltransferase involved in cell wall bisynthesis n=1 Tax=Clostridium gasigenes TaxID=94869 RepID=A0A1H0TG91_9CLOT|nr:glycosyltransferase family A protein [Clostridium gasigenes]MBU3090135.1 glycosyltransferase family 2 protein [Clostridium gasigenes]SDP52855.1 Glycosyltransferase involved in cell wall bisynthesis [Clostridium gasigenes]
MNIKPLVSVIIPFYNGVDWLIEAVNSVLNQTYTNYEILIINDGSKENMDSFLLEYEEKIIYIKKENGGPASARNLGIRKARGEYLAFLDSDDLWTSDKLEYQISEMIEKNSSWSQTSYELFGNRTDGKKVNAILEPKLFNKMLFISNGIATPTIMIKKSSFNEEKLFFMENRRYGEDTELWVRLSKKSDILSVDRVLTKVRIRGSNAGLTVIAQLQNRAEIYDDIKGRKEVSCGLIINYKLCNIVYKIIIFIKTNISDNKYLIDSLAKVGYIIPYSIFKVYKKIYIRKYN